MKHKMMILGVVLCLSLAFNVAFLLERPGSDIVYAGGTPSGNGDVNASGAIDIADAIYLLTYLFGHGPIPEPIQSSSGALPATGQTKCYAMNGSEVACNDPNVPGQDGYYQKGCPTANRFVDNGNGTVTDTCTGLMWQKDTADINGDGTYTWEQDEVTWQQALQYCESLEFAGHSDWRLPNVRELQSIVDYGRYGPSIDPVFSVWAESWWYWSSSTGAGHPDYAWGVDFVGGSVPVDYKGVGGCVRAVRG